jgi:predicted MFS family arabinose efflux permease
MRPLPATLIRLAWANLAAQAADQLALAAIPMLAVLHLGAGAGDTGLLAAAQTLPFLLLSIPAGLLADRGSRRRLMTGAEIVRLGALAAIPALAATGGLSIAALALLGGIAPRDGLAAANARLELARSAAFAAGPALAGALLAGAGVAVAFVLAVGLSALAAALLAGIGEPARASAPRRHVMAELAEGARFTLAHPLLRPILATAVAWNIAWFVLQAVFVPFALGRLGLDTTGVGVSLGAYGAGMLAGALLAPRLAQWLRFGMLITLGPLASVGAAMAVAGSVALPGIALPMLGFFLFGAGPILWTIGQTTLRQAVTPGALLGRVSAMMSMAATGARPLGAAIGGLVGARFGLDAAVLLACAGFVVQAVLILASPVPALARQPEAA